MRSNREREQDETEDCTDGAEADTMASAQPTRDARYHVQKHDQSQRTSTRAVPGGWGRLFHSLMEMVRLCRSGCR